MNTSKMAVLVAVGLMTSVAHAVTVTRGPYLQTQTTSSIIVRWRTDVPTDSRVSFGAAVGSLTNTVDDGAATTEHVVAVTGLAADTGYYYAVGSVSGALVGDDPDYVFNTAPAPGTERPMRFWLPGDGGFYTGAQAPNTVAVRNAYTAFTAGRRTDLFLPLGDNAYLVGTDAEFQGALFDMHHDLLRNTPVYPIYGNHEEFSSDTLTATGPFFDMFTLPTAGEGGGVPSGSETYFSFDYGNVHFVVLDSEQSPTSATTPQMLWLTADLQATTAKWIIALWHRPPYSRGLLHNSDTEAEEIRMRQFAVPILEAYGVDLVLNGHSHSYERSYLLDGHYGLANTFGPANQMDAGDGDPTTGGSGAYRKPEGLTANNGAVYVVGGSSSEVRPTTLNHPAHVVGLLEHGSVVLDVDGNVATVRFLNKDGNVTDHFQVVKGDACPPTPRPGCEASAKGKLVLKNNAIDAKDKLTFKWKDGTLPVADVGTPEAQTDLAICVYDAGGVLAGGLLPHGGGLWKASGSGLRSYNDPLLSAHGIQKLKIKPGIGAKGLFVGKGKGAGLALPALPATLPLTVQLWNPGNDECWQTTYVTAKKNDAAQVVAVTP